MIVPDNYPTIQAALDAGAIEILIRPGTYLETPVITDIPPNFGNDDLVLRGLVPAGSPPDSLPLVTGLVFDDLVRGFTHTPSVTIEDLRFSNTVLNAFDWSPYSNPFVIRFSRCVLESGINDGPATAGGQLEYGFLNCTINGPVSFGQPERVWVTSTSLMRLAVSGQDFVTVTNSHLKGSGGIGVEVGNAQMVVAASGNLFEGYDIALQVVVSRSASLDIRNNTFLGPGRFGVNYTTGPDGLVSRNAFRGFDVGLHHDGALESGLPLGVYSFVNNRFEVCEIAGMDVAAEYIECARDTIISCGAGAIIQASSYSPQATVIATANVILSCAGNGLVVRATDAQIESNVVGRCGGDGISTTIDYGPYGAETRLRANTSFLNAGAGFALAFSGGPVSVDHNIGHGNGASGLEVSTSVPITIGCNDWFANVAGASQGIAPGGTDLAVDPLFCHTAESDVHLTLDSPLANAAGCGLIGALGIGCETTPVLVDQFTAWRRQDGRIVIQWRIRGDLAAQVRVERSEHTAGPWVGLAGSPQDDGGLLTLVDPDAEPGRAYWYRLIEEDPVEATQVVATTFISASVHGDGFGLEPIGGNPGAGPFSIRFRVPTPATLDLQVFDVQGRRITQLASGAWPAGSHEVRWSGRDARGRPMAGIHLIRYRFPGGETTQRIALIR